MSNRPSVSSSDVDQTIDYLERRATDVIRRRRRLLRDLEYVIEHRALGDAQRERLRKTLERLDDAGVILWTE